MKGKQVVLTTAEDIKTMYATHKKSKRFNFWFKCKPKSSKRSADSQPADPPQSKRQASLLTMMNEVDTIVQQLKQKHGTKYKDAQYNCWAHMYHTHKHPSLDEAPKGAFFGKPKGKDCSGISPSKRISLRSECMTQLDKWHQLMERNIISRDEYEELQSKILGDIKNF